MSPSHTSMLGKLIIVACIFCIVGAQKQAGEDEKISINLDQALHSVSDQFLSITIDSGAIAHNWDGLDLKSEAVINMGKALAPAMLRIGGTEEDFVIFKSNATQSDHYSKRDLDVSYIREDRPNITLSASLWDAINEYAQAVGWDIVFGLNVFLRSPWPHGSWDTTNAEELMKYSKSKGYNTNWELGNEPDLFPKVTNTTVVEAEQLAKDFKSLKQLLARLNMQPKYIAGPDVATLSGDHDYFENFLKYLEPGLINAVTWHHYYTDGRTAKLSDFTSIELLDKFIDRVTDASTMAQKYDQNIEVWLGETSSCYGGGAPGISDTYVAGFMWLDKLGLSAVINHTRVFRQAFIGGNYGLIDSNANPLPDFWLSALYKKLVGTKVLDVDGSTKNGRAVRVYAHCAMSPLYPEGDVVLIVLNLNHAASSVMLTDQELSSKSRDVYWLTLPTGSNDLQSKQVALNGKLLGLINNSTLSDLTPVQKGASDTLQLPPLSFGFLVFKDVKAKACLESGLGHPQI